VISARYRTKCPGCSETIEEGDPIGRVDGEWVCEDCADGAGGEDFPDRDRDGDVLW